MRWVVFILLLLGIVFCLSYFAPAAAGKAGLFWPFDAGSKPIADFVGGLPGQSGNITTSFLAGVAGVFFLTAIVGLFWKAVPTNWWPVFVIVAGITSLLLYVSYFGVRMIIPILVDVILLWGVLTKRWSAGVLRMRTLYAESAGMHPLLRIPVPWVFILTYLIGVGLQYLVPLTIHSTAILLISHIVGIVLMIGGVLLAVLSLRIFSVARTTTIPFEKASKLVTWGPYRFSRNPMYVGLILIYLGEAGLLVQIWPLLLLPLVVLYIHKIVIPIEEARLQEVFRDAYVQYCASVRRWI